MLKDRNTDASIISMDMVYVPDSTSDFRSVHIEARAKDDKLQIFINSAIDIEIKDLEILINKLQRDTLAKMKLRIVEDCDLFLNINDKTYQIEFAPSPVKVGGFRLITQ